MRRECDQGVRRDRLLRFAGRRAYPTHGLASVGGRPPLTCHGPAALLQQRPRNDSCPSCRVPRSADIIESTRTRTRTQTHSVGKHPESSTRGKRVGAGANLAANRRPPARPTEKAAAVVPGSKHVSCAHIGFCWAGGQEAGEGGDGGEEWQDSRLSGPSSARAAGRLPTSAAERRVEQMRVWVCVRAYACVRVSGCWATAAKNVSERPTSGSAIGLERANEATASRTRGLREAGRRQGGLPSRSRGGSRRNGDSSTTSSLPATTHHRPSAFHVRSRRREHRQRGNGRAPVVRCSQLSDHAATP